jgi:hypothetical protein
MNPTWNLTIPSPVGDGAILSMMPGSPEAGTGVSLGSQLLYTRTLSQFHVGAERTIRDLESLWTVVAHGEAVLLPPEEQMISACDSTGGDADAVAPSNSRHESDHVSLRIAEPELPPLDFIASNPVGIWEGKVVEILPEARMIVARLRPIKGSDAEMSGEISFDQISGDDKELVHEGSLFYIEQFRRVVKLQVSFVQHVRFRRIRPRSTASMDKIELAAQALVGVDKPPKLAP